MAKTKTMYVCSSCGEESLVWQGRCPVCGAWNSFKEIKIESRSTTGKERTPSVPVGILDVAKSLDANKRYTTGISEFDRVLGGGIVPGSVILLGGEPGIGKSTLLLQTAQILAQSSNVIYFSGEESESQVAHRAQRLGITPTFLFGNETNVESITDTIRNEHPTVVIVDSIQTLYNPNFPSTPGSLVQVRECALQLQELAKREGVSVILVGHITKEGTVAGPKTLEHMVDVVLYLEGESRSEIRILRSMKNRFGPTHEVGLFALGEQGMLPVANPSLLFTEEHRGDVAGTALTSVIEGVRPMLVEIQALVVPTTFGYPKRTSLGIDVQHLHIVLAILESRTGANFSQHDVFINVVGGYRLHDRTADLAIAMALLSALSNVSLPEKQVFYGEVGLTGEIRNVPTHDRRITEIERLGYVPSPSVRRMSELGEQFHVLGRRRKTT